MSEHYSAQGTNQRTRALPINFHPDGILNGNNFDDDEYWGFLHMTNYRWLPLDGLCVSVDSFFEIV